MVQWLRLHATNAGDSNSIPDWGTKIPHAVWYGQKKEKKRIGSLVKFHLIKKDLMLKKEFPGGIVGKEPACQCRRHKTCSSIPGS